MDIAGMRSSNKTGWNKLPWSKVRIVQVCKLAIMHFYKHRFISVLMEEKYKECCKKWT